MNADLFAKSRVIAAAHGKSGFDAALACPLDNFFVLGVTLSELPFVIAAAKEKQKRLFVHIDTIDGLGKDSAAVDFVAKLAPFGIISTRSGVVKYAKSCGLCVVQRFFLIDRQSVRTALDSLQSTAPDFVECMPGTVCKAFGEFASVGIPVIAGGLIETSDEVTGAFAAGAAAVSTSEKTLWQ